MAYRFEKNVKTGEPEVVLDGFEKGIADSPYEGIADMRNVNVISAPKEVSVNFATQALTTPPAVTAQAFTATASTDVIAAVNITGFYNGMAITIVTLVGGTGISLSRVYWIGNLTSTGGNTGSFKLYKNPNLNVGTLVDITLDGTGTYSTYTLTAPLDRVFTFRTQVATVPAYEFILDDSGKVWWIYNVGGVVTNYLVYLGNDTLTGTTGRAIQILENYIIVFRTSTTDYMTVSNLSAGSTVDLDSGTGWVYGWTSVTTVTQARRPTLVGQDIGIYYGNGNRLGSILENAGKNFDPSDGTTYTKNTTALAIPNGDDVNAIGELGPQLLIGGLKNFIYPWDRVSTSFTYPLVISENLTTRIVTSNANAYIFAGNRGRIFITNGANIDLYKKIPDSITGEVDPYFAWQDAVYWKNQVYFSFTATTNGGVSIDTVAGVWAIDVDSDAFRYTNQLSYGAYTGITSVLLQNLLSNTPGGTGLYVGWSNSTTYGVDVGSSSPYTGGQTIIDFDMIPVGTFLNPETITNIEWKTTRPLVAGEAVSLYQRSSFTGSFSLIGTSNTVGDLSGLFPSNFQNVQWLQIRAALTSTASSPSFVRLRDVRFR